MSRVVYYGVSAPQGIRIETVEQLANTGISDDYPAGEHLPHYYFCGEEPSLLKGD